MYFSNLNESILASFYGERKQNENIPFPLCFGRRNKIYFIFVSYALRFEYWKELHYRDSFSLSTVFLLNLETKRSCDLHDSYLWLTWLFFT